MEKLTPYIFSLSMIFAIPALAQSRIACKPEMNGGTSIQSIWPTPYLSKKGELCFDVKGWPEYSGQNCITNGGNILWTGLVVVYMDGESRGRDSMFFRVIHPVVNDERIEYTIEWTRNNIWQPMQHVGINRLSGQAVSYFVTMNGGDSYQCHLERRKL